MSEHSLQACYQRLKQMASGDVESFAVVAAVDKHRLHWKPERVRVLLLAESHVFTTDSEFKSQVNGIARLSTRLPREFVRFVYCLGYGENDLLNGELSKPRNSGTPQYWQLFWSCLNRVETISTFDHILVSRNRNTAERIRRKFELLRKLMDRGIWLLDASPIGLYRPGATNKPNAKEIVRVLQSSWDCHIKEVILKCLRCSPLKLLIIGKGVEAALRTRLLDPQFSTVETMTIPQPAAFLTRAERDQMFRDCYEFCN